MNGMDVKNQLKFEYSTRLTTKLTLLTDYENEKDVRKSERDGGRKRKQMKNVKTKQYN